MFISIEFDIRFGIRRNQGRSVETMSSKKPADTMPTIKPCKTMSAKKLADTMPTIKTGETMLIKPCETMFAQKSAVTTVLVKSCETTPERSVKKRRVMSMEEEEEEEQEEEEEEGDDKEVNEADWGMEPDSKEPPDEFDQGEHVDVKALLSTEARNFLVTAKGGETVPVASLEGKYVLICCFLIPFRTNGLEASICRSLEALYHELSIKGIVDNVKLVVVAKIASGFGEVDFESFLSTLSLDCLAIPFSDSVSRDKVCESLDLHPEYRSRFVPCLAVHPNSTVLQMDPFFLDNYGADSFPFTTEHFVKIRSQDKIIRDRLRFTDSPISLRELLESDHLSRIADESSCVRTSNLCNSDTVVALYLCYDGKFLAKLQNIHKKCVDEGHKFEIVLVPVPYRSHYDPASFCNLMKQSALENSKNSSWLVFPFQDKICRTLWRLYHCRREDHLIIMPYGEQPGDLWGRHIASSYDINAYPFTRDIIVQMKVTDGTSASEILSDLEEESWY